MNAFIAGNLKSKTNWAAVGMAIVGVLHDSFPEILALLPAGSNAYLIAAALMIVMRNVTKTSIAEKGGSQGGFAHPSMLVLLAAIATMLLAGCASNGSLSAGEKAALREVAAIGVSRYVRENADSDRVEHIRAVLVELQQLPDITTVDGLRALVQVRIDSQVSDPWDRQDLTRLLNVLAPLLTDYVGSGQLAPDAVVEVRDFLAYLAAALPPAS